MCALVAIIFSYFSPQLKNHQHFNNYLINLFFALWPIIVYFTLILCLFQKFVLIFNSAFLLTTYCPIYVRYCKHDNYVLYHLSYCAVGWGGGAADWFCPPLCVFAIVAWLEGIT